VAGAEKALRDFGLVVVDIRGANLFLANTVTSCTFRQLPIFAAYTTIGIA
jgi:hypothetical protein